MCTFLGLQLQQVLLNLVHNAAEAMETTPLLADDIPNLIVTPHSAWAGRQARQNAVDETVANIQAFLDGQLRNRVV